MFDVIKEELEELENNLQESIKADDELVTEIGLHLVTSGGKRLRPALCLLAAHGGKDYELAKVLPLATALELIHTASLVHDDVIDEAGTRRGVITANAKWGNKLSILSGDFIFARAFRLVASGDYGNYVADRLAYLVCNLSVGEIIQDKRAFEASTDVADYYDRIKKKTADFVEICCELGGHVGGLSKEDTKKLATYGSAIGMAFQITDDLLDIMQSSEKIGKPAGNDIRQGIVTLPVIYALENSKFSDELGAIVTNKDMTDAMVERALEIVRESGGTDFAMNKADEYLKGAKEIIPESLPADIKDAFIQVADFIGERDF